MNVHAFPISKVAPWFDGPTADVEVSGVLRIGSDTVNDFDAVVTVYRDRQTGTVEVGERHVYAWAGKHRTKRQVKSTARGFDRDINHFYAEAIDEALDDAEQWDACVEALELAEREARHDP